MATGQVGATPWTSMGASRRGTAHVRRGEPRQDARTVQHLPGGVLVAVVADGAGSARHGGTGAAAAARIVARAAEDALARRPFDGLDEEDLRDWTDAARDVIGRGAARRSQVGTPTTLRDFATTLLLAVSNGRRTWTAHVGDGAIVGRVAEDASWRMLSWPASGDYAGTTYFLTDEPAPQLRVEHHDAPLSGLALLSDGLERLVLDFAARTAHGPFFDRMAGPLDARAGTGEDGPARDLSRALGAYLDGEAVCARSDDDKTLVVAVRAEEAPTALTATPATSTAPASVPDAAG